MAIFGNIFCNIFGKKLDYRNKLISGTDTDTKNVPGISKFSDVHFCKSFGYLAIVSKLLTERSALANILSTKKYKPKS